MWLEQKEELEIDLYNAKAEKFNEIEIMMFQHAKEKKEMRKLVKDLKMASSRLTVTRTTLSRIPSCS